MTDNLVAALARCQAKFPPIVKSHTNGGFKSQYADVADVLAAVVPVLAAEGIFVSQTTSISDEGGVILETTLEWSGDDENEMRSEFPLYVAGLTAQQVGSLLTYHRRYQLCAILGVHPVGDDDDGNLAATAPARPVKLNEAVYKAAAVGDPYELAAATPPEKPLAAMTAGEMARYAESIGVRVSGSKADILRQLQPIVLAATGEEPFGTWVREPEGDASGSAHPSEEERPEFSPVVAGSATVRTGVRSSLAAEK